MAINHGKRKLIKNTADLSVSSAQAIQKLDLVMATLIRVLYIKGIVTEDEFSAEFEKIVKPKEDQHGVQKEAVGKTANGDM
jgi:hypothetical protein